MSSNTAREIERCIAPAQSVVVAPGAAEPATLTESLVARRHAIGQLDVVLGLSATRTFRPEHADCVRFTTLGSFGHNVPLVSLPAVRVLPVHYGDVPRLIAERAIAADVLLVQVAPPDVNGNCSVGVAAEYLRAAIERVETIVAEMNDQVPVVPGAPSIPTDRLASMIRTSRPLPGIVPRDPGPRGAAMARHLASVVRDGSVIQVGVGGLLDAAVGGLTARRGLRVHSGLMTDGLRSLVDAGAVACDARSPELVATAVMGSPSLYRWVADQSRLRLRDVSYTHAPSVLSALEQFVSINAAIEVDLRGQVNAEMSDGTYIGGVGGAPAFAHAARLSPGGGSVFLLPATTRDGASRIVGRLGDGVVTTLSADVSFVITEYGVADLRDATLAERADRLIAVAAPEHRSALPRKVP